MAERRVRKPRVPRKRSSSHKNEQKLTAWSTTDDTSEDSCSSSSASEEFISFSPRRVKKKSKHATQAKPSAPLGKQEEEDLSMKYILQLIESGEIEASQDVINNIRGVNPEPSSSISAPMSQSRTTSVHRSHSMSSSSSQSASRREKKARKRTKRSDRRSDRDRGESETRRPHRSRRNRSSTRDRARRATKEAREQRRSSSSATAQDLRRARNPNQHRLRVALRSSDDGINPFEEDYTSLATLQPHYTAQVNNDQIASDEAYARELQVMESLGLGEAVGISSSDSSPQLPSPELLESSNEFELASDSDDDESSQVTRQEVVQFLNRLQLASTILNQDARETPAIFSTLHNILNKIPKGASNKDTLPVFEYKGHGSANGEDTTCCICLQNFELGQQLKIVPCLHKFHEKCIDPWLSDHDVCPICKHKVDE